MEPANHKRRASSWATLELQQLAVEAAQEEVDMKKATSTPALRQLLACRPEAAPTDPSTDGVPTEATGGAGAPGMTGFATSTGERVSKSTSLPARMSVCSDSMGSGLPTGTSFPAASNPNETKTNIVGMGSPGGAASGSTGGIIPNVTGSAADLNAFTAAAAAAGAVNPLLFATMNMNIGVKMGFNLANMATSAAQGAAGGRQGAIGGGGGTKAGGRGGGGGIGGLSAAGTGEGRLDMRIPRSDSIPELQDVGDERGSTSVGWAPEGLSGGVGVGGGVGGGPIGGADGAISGPIGGGGSSNNLTSGEETDDGFDLTELNLYGTGGTEEGWFGGGHPSVEPKEEGSLKRRFKSCPDLHSGVFSGGIITKAPAVGSVLAPAQAAGDGISLGTGGVTRAGRMLVPLAPMTSQPDQGLSQEFTASRLVHPSPATAVGGQTLPGTGMNLANISFMQQMAAAAAGAAAQAAAAAAAVSGDNNGVGAAANVMPGADGDQQGNTSVGFDTSARHHAGAQAAAAAASAAAAAAAARAVAVAAVSAGHNNEAHTKNNATEAKGTCIVSPHETMKQQVTGAAVVGAHHDNGADSPAHRLSLNSTASYGSSGAGLLQQRAAGVKGSTSAAGGAGAGLGVTFTSGIKAPQSSASGNDGGSLGGAAAGAGGMKPVASCPNIGSLGNAGPGQGQEERRSRRLERNRASARVRRQRKKDMVELYEKEVARLERGIKVLQMHAWGGGKGAALADALGVDLGEDGTGRGAGVAGADGSMATPFFSEQERASRRDLAAAKVEEHLQDIAREALDAHAIAAAFKAASSNSHMPTSSTKQSPSKPPSSAVAGDNSNSANQWSALDVAKASESESSSQAGRPRRAAARASDGRSNSTSAVDSEIRDATARVERAGSSKGVDVSRRDASRVVGDGTVDEPMRGFKREEGCEDAGAAGEAEEKLNELLKVLRLEEGQPRALITYSEDWEEEMLIAQVLAKVSSALRLPGRMDTPSVKVTAEAFESLTSPDQRSKFHRWVNSNRQAVSYLDGPASVASLALSDPDYTSVSASTADSNPPSTTNNSTKSGVELNSTQTDDVNNGVSSKATSSSNSGSARGSALKERSSFPALSSSGSARDSVRFGDADWNITEGAAGVGVRTGVTSGSPLFRFRSQDGEGEADEDSRGVGIASRTRAGTLSLLAMDQSA